MLEVSPDPAEYSGKTVETGPGAIVSSSSYWQVDKSSAYYHSLDVLFFFSPLHAFNLFDIFIIVEAASRQFDLGTAESSKLL